MKPQPQQENLIVKFSDSVIDKPLVIKLHLILVSIGLIKSCGYYLIIALINELDNTFQSESKSILTLRYSE